MIITEGGHKHAVADRGRAEFATKSRRLVTYNSGIGIIVARDRYAAPAERASSRVSREPNFRAMSRSRGAVIRFLSVRGGRDAAP